MFLYAPTLQSSLNMSCILLAEVLSVFCQYMYAPHNSFLTFQNLMMPVCSFGEGTHPDEARRGERYIGTHPDEAQRGCAEFLSRNLVSDLLFAAVITSLWDSVTVKLWCITFIFIFQSERERVSQHLATEVVKSTLLAECYVHVLPGHGVRSSICWHVCSVSKLHFYFTVFLQERTTAVCRRLGLGPVRRLRLRP